MKKNNGYTIHRFPLNRIFTIDIGVLGSEKHHVKVLLELDVTKALQKIKKIRESGKHSISFTAWFLKCMADALAANPQMHALAAGGNRLVFFNEVDISLMVEKVKDGYHIPVPYVIRQADRKTVEQIFNEIEHVKKSDLSDKKNIDDYAEKIPFSVFLRLPQFIRLFIWRIVLRNPERVKKLMGTCLFTSVGMFGKVPGWAVPFSIHPISFTLGSITRKLFYVNGLPENRDVLHLTVLIDHNVIDGAPAARFISSFQESVENGNGL